MKLSIKHTKNIVENELQKQMTTGYGSASSLLLPFGNCFNIPFFSLLLSRMMLRNVAAMSCSFTATTVRSQYLTYSAYVPYCTSKGSEAGNHEAFWPDMLLCRTTE